MLEIKDYKKTSLEFRRIASNMLTTEYTNPNIPLYRFKNYIDTNEIIKNIVQTAIEDVNYDYKECFKEEDSYWNNVSIPINEKEHLKAMYDYMSYIVDNQLNVQNIAFSYSASGKITDIIRYFLTLAFKPLVDYIVDELSKLVLMLEEEQMKNITINDNKGVVNLAEKNSSIVSNNTITISDNDLKSITELIASLKEELTNTDIENETKENIVDDLDTLQEQIDNSIDKPARFKKAFNNIKNFLTSSALVVGASVTLGNNINDLVQLVQPIIEKI